MANLDLIPKLPVLAVQAGIFVANLGIMKKLFMEPYLKVRNAQDSQTIGSQGDAARLLAQADQVSAEINARLQAALVMAKEGREKVRGVAVAKRQALLGAAQAEVKSELDRVEGDIKAQIEAERAKVPNVVASLANEVYKIALN
jgi:F0F1-type ATP synthase membrane subunit b/b'